MLYGYFLKEYLVNESKLMQEDNTITTDPVAWVDKQLHSIIDCMHPKFKSISDEEQIDEYQDRAVFARNFLHETGKTYRMQWTVYFGSPDTVKTVFMPAEEIKG
jgi:hypothetical protein